MDIAVVGAGHVGLVSGACFGAVGHRVRIEDPDDARIKCLARGEAPFIEPGLDQLLSEGLASGRLSFHVDPEEAIPQAELIFICVPTSAEGDTADLSAVIDATVAVARYGSEGAVLVNRTTAPIGTLECLRTLLEEDRAAHIGVATNPDFGAEGTAVADFLAPDRVVVGAWEEAVVERVVQAYRPIVDGRLPPSAAALVSDRRVGRPIPLLVTTPESAELSKYAANAFLAVKISFINEIAAVADESGADIDDVTRTIGLDPRVGEQFLRAGLGWGGSCFPKSIAILKRIAETSGASTPLLSAANEVNDGQRRWVVRTLRRHLKTLAGRRVGLLGLSFKPSTDDTRNAPALEIAAELVRLNVHVRAFDPVVTRLPRPLDDAIELVSDVRGAALHADALVVATEWEEFANLPFDDIRQSMHVPLLVDGRNCIDQSAAQAAGFVYVGVGRGGATVLPIASSPTGEASSDPSSSPETPSTRVPARRRRHPAKAGVLRERTPSAPNQGGRKQAAPELRRTT